MKENLREIQGQEHRGSLIGLALTFVAHAAACLAVSFSGLKYIYPPPPESAFVIDFNEEEIVKLQPRRRGTQPQAEQVDRTKAIELVQKSESPHKATAKQNLTPATAPDDFGDVETPAVEQEKALDPRAAFPGMSKKDTSLTAPHSADESKALFKAGQVEGNTRVGKTEGTANAHLKGRHPIGDLPRPAYDVQKEGTVVVSVWVDNYGKVVKALAGVDGTNVTDKTLWAAARNAAMKSTFNWTMDAPAMQEGTITYFFKLK